MATISSGIAMDANIMNLKEISLREVRPEVSTLMVGGENMVMAFQTVRDQVIFTDKRIFVVNVQGITGKKVSYYSYPYSKIQYFGIETAGVLDIDSEIFLASGGIVYPSGQFRNGIADLQIGIAVAVQKDRRPLSADLINAETGSVGTGGRYAAQEFHRIRNG